MSRREAAERWKSAVEGEAKLRSRTSLGIAAIVIVVMFLKSRIQLKLKEVEARQAHERLMRKRARKEETQSGAEEETR